MSPLKLVPNHAAGEYRLIHNLSFPHYNGFSVNSGIDSEFSYVTYETLDHVISLILTIAAHCYIAKSDLANAFCWLCVDVASRRLLGFMLMGAFFYDNCLPMGASNSCAEFDKLSSALQWIFQNHLGVTYSSHILDDHIFLSHSKEECATY